MYWNEIVREAAKQDLARAARVAAFPNAELIMQTGPGVADAVAREADARHCTLIVVPASRLRLRLRTSLQRAWAKDRCAGGRANLGAAIRI
jgi:nucleotide-binding universal stress UspA family protein